MRKEPQRPRRGNLGIFLPQRPCRSIARVGKYLPVLRLLRLVYRCKVRLGHIDFAAYLEDIGHIAV